MRSLTGFARLLWSAARWQAMTAVLLATALSVTEGVSLALIFPLLAVLGDPAHPAASSTGPGTRWMLHLLALSGLPRAWWLGTLLVGIVLAVGLLAQWNGILQALTLRVLARVRERLGAQMYAAIVEAEWSFLVRGRSSDLTLYLTTELDRVGQLSSSFMLALSNGMVTLLMLGLALYLSPVLTLLALVCFGLLVPWQRRSGRRIYQAGVAMSADLSAVFDSSMERLGNLKVVKAFGAQKQELALFTRRHGTMLDRVVDNEWQASASSRHFQLLSLGLLCGIVLLGLGPLHLAPATLLIFLFAFLRATPRVQALQEKANSVLANLPAFHAIEAFLTRCASHAEDPEPASSEPAPTLERELVLHEAAYAYTEGGPLVLQGVTLRIEAGRITALAGASGAGKSTVADLLLGLLEPQGGGTLQADGVPIDRRNARAWRRRIGYVSQDTLLFHDTVRANLLWAVPEASEGELHAALEQASAEFVHTLPQGLDTVVGDRGILFSHGQRQRIALARALLRRPALLVLDEATNSLDLENEESILEAVRASGSGGRVTTLLISHRPSAVRLADRVYVLEGGRIRQSKTGDAADVQAASEPAARENISP